MEDAHDRITEAKRQQLLQACSAASKWTGCMYGWFSNIQMSRVQWPYAETFTNHAASILEQLRSEQPLAKVFWHHGFDDLLTSIDISERIYEIDGIPRASATHAVEELLDGFLDRVHTRKQELPSVRKWFDGAVKDYSPEWLGMMVNREHERLRAFLKTSPGDELDGSELPPLGEIVHEGDFSHSIDGKRECVTPRPNSPALSTSSEGADEDGRQPTKEQVEQVRKLCKAQPSAKFHKLYKSSGMGKQVFCRALKIARNGDGSAGSGVP
jgi:hypothetical protein